MLAAIVVASVIREIVWPKALIPLKGIDRVIGWTTGVVTAVFNPTGELCDIICSVGLSASSF